MATDELLVEDDANLKRGLDTFVCFGFESLVPLS